jgi:elongation factor P
LTAEELGEQSKWLKEGENVVITSYEDRIIGLEPPKTVERRVIKTDPGVRGDTVQGGEKPAIIEGGAAVSVPLFIKIGDVIRVATGSGEYVARVSTK